MGEWIRLKARVAAGVILKQAGPASWRKRELHGYMGLGRTAIVLCCLVVMALAGCATTRGLGQDTQSLGRGIEKLGK